MFYRVRTESKEHFDQRDMLVAITNQLKDSTLQENVIQHNQNKSKADDETTFLNFNTPIFHAKGVVVGEIKLLNEDSYHF